MAWENAEKIFHQDFVNINNMAVPVRSLPDSDVELITDDRYRLARNMLIKSETFAWGSEGEFAVRTNYDIMNALPRPEQDIPALSCYGMRMLRDYCIMNNINLNI